MFSYKMFLIIPVIVVLVLFVQLLNVLAILVLVSVVQGLNVLILVVQTIDVQDYSSKYCFGPICSGTKCSDPSYSGNRS